MAKIRNSAEFIRASELMLAGITNQEVRLKDLGVNSTFITEFTSRHNNYLDVINTQQALKARWMEKTVERLKFQEMLEEYYRRAKKIVKLELPEETWREFGITDKW